MTWARGAVIVPATFLAAAIAACGGSSTTEESGPPALTEAELKDPQKCQTCHPDAFDQWSRSMHAYAADDPVFKAMNARGQRETNGKLGDFCVKCHAPVALRDKLTTDGTNLDKLPAEERGVTCFFCHSAKDVHGTHDAPITLATDGVMRASIKDPVKTTAHEAAYEALLDREQPEAATLCGSCHDIVTSGGAHIERTFEEWQGTVFSHGSVRLTCGGCHMTGREGFAAHAPGVSQRRIHDHGFPAIDVALDSFPGQSTLKEEVQAFLDTSIQSALCVKASPGFSNIQVVLDNVGAGHDFPSGATQDRRSWMEVKASEKGKLIYSSGVVPKGKSPTDIADSDLWLLRSCMFDAQKKPVDMFWQAVTTASDLLPGPVTIDTTDPDFYKTHVAQAFPRATEKPIESLVDDVTAKLHFVPIGLDVLDDLVKSGDLDPKVKDAMPDFTVAGADLHWTEKDATIHYLDKDGLPVSCVAIGLTTGANNANPAPSSRCTK